ncbi:MAG: hypothetical protein M1497_07160 [Nitrospirae bacterium]|nr:hypothetical protein [Nitrospirota bacterium]
MKDGITIRILGDYGPFSRMGKSVGYQVTIGRSSFLLDCGSPLFQQIGGHGLKKIKGLIITHCHDDHKRWFTDFALFNMYAPDVANRVFLLASEDVHNDLMRASGPSLERSLSADSRNVIDIPYEAYIDYRTLGPRARYRIVPHQVGPGHERLCVVDGNGSVLGPERAKIVISEKTKRPRLLFRDPFYKEWVEPESFYPFSSDVFYEEEKNLYRDEEGFTIAAIKAPVWHGITGIGIVIRTGEETLVFSSDTVHDTELWKDLHRGKRVPRVSLSGKEFESASLLYGDINDYIERVWSEERYREAVDAFRNSVVIHDISARKSVVHTDYENLHRTSLTRENAILTHSPDAITSEWVLCGAEKSFRIRGGRFFEVVGDRLCPMNAHIYHKEAGKYYVGYRREKGRYTVYEDRGLLRISAAGSDRAPQGKLLYAVDLYEDLSGGYFPKIEKENAAYLERKDGKVELVEFDDEGSTGKIVGDCRDKLLAEEPPGTDFSVDMR